jgi:PAS domain S-box-containing protein
MKQIKKASKKTIDKKAKKKIEPKKIIDKKVKQKTEPKLKNLTGEKIEDVKRLVYLLQVHQVELEHQNEELRIAQEELEVSRNKYVNLFDFSPIPYFTLNKHGIIKEVNLSASKMFGIDRSKLIDKSFINFVTLDDKNIFKAFINSVFSTPIKQSCELKMINKDNREFYILLEGLVLDDALDSGQKCQIALIDLTEYKRIENSLKVSNEELKTLNSTKDKFFSIIAHDLRGPFQSLLSYSEMLAMEMDTLSQEEIIQFSKGLYEILTNLYSLLENLLHWSMMQRDMIEYNPVGLNLYDVVNKIVGISNQNAMKKNISISNNVGTGIFVYADVNMLRSIIQNLIMNAIKFTPSEGRIIVSSAIKNGIVEVAIQDTGIGIDPEKSSKLFNFITIFTTKGTAGEEGTGLGLPLCKEFVEKQGGKIWVESELGNGSKFTFTLRKTIP